VLTKAAAPAPNKALAKIFISILLIAQEILPMPHK